jgi:hypothetical protein
MTAEDGPMLTTWALQQVVSFLGYTGRAANVAATAESDPGCVKTLRGMTAPRISRLVVALRAKKAKIRPSLGITTKSDFVFTQPRPKAAVAVAAFRFSMIGRSVPLW